MRELSNSNRSREFWMFWMFWKHLVNPLRIRIFNEVNTAKGYGPVVIVTPEDASRIWKEENDDEDE